jgi:hypothetical protein
MPRSSHDLPDELERASADLDRLIGEVRAGIRGAGHYDRLEAEGQAIAVRIVKGFRGADARPSTVTVTPSRDGRGVWVR